MMPSWLAVVAVLSGLCCLCSGELVRRRWQKPGSFWFTVAAAACALWAISYGVALATFDPTVRRVLEIPIWVGHGVAPVAFLLFVASYTGQLRPVSRMTVLSLWIIPVLTIVLTATNGGPHSLMWTGYEIVPTVEAATVAYEKGPWLYVHKLYSYAVLAIAAGILLELFAERGALYSRQAVSLAAVVIPMGTASVVWVLEIGPAPQLSLTPFLFGPVFVVASVVLFRSRLFDSSPAARQVGRRRLFEDFGDGVLIIDEQGRIVEANDPAMALFSDQLLLGEQIDTVVGADVSTTPGRHQLAIETSAGQQPYEIVVSPLSEEDGTTLGRSLVFQDVSEATRRQQQLAVLNRALRHNLRNDMTVVTGYTEQIASEAPAPYDEMAATAAEQAASLVKLGEQARRIEHALDDNERQQIAINTVVQDVVSEFPSSAIEVEGPDSLSASTYATTLRAVLFAAVENAVEHAGEDPEITVAATAENGWIRCTVRDDGPGIPEHEQTPIEAGTETALEHGSGLGLWLIVWGASHLGGTATFETGDDGTTVSVRFPATPDESSPD